MGKTTLARALGAPLTAPFTAFSSLLTYSRQTSPASASMTKRSGNSSLNLAGFSPTSWWVTKSTAPLPRPSQLCSRPWENVKSQQMA